MTTYLTVHASDLSDRTRAILDASDHITDEALAEIESVGVRVPDPEVHLDGAEGWYLDEDGNSIYVAARSEEYLVREYAADGGVEPSNPYEASATTLDEAREKVRALLGVRRLDPRRRWSPPASGVVEAYHKYPRSHPQAYGCGGYEIVIRSHHVN